MPGTPIRPRFVGRGREIGYDCANPRLGRIGALAIGAAAIAVLGVPIVSSWLGVGIFDLIVRRRHRVAVAVSVIISVGGAQHNVTDTGAAHDGLMAIGANPTVQGKLCETSNVTVLGLGKRSCGGAR